MSGIVNDTWYYLSASEQSNGPFDLKARKSDRLGSLSRSVMFGIAAVKIDISEFLSQENHVTDFFIDTGSDSDEIIASGGRISPEWGATKHETIILCSGWQQGSAKGIRVRMNWLSDSPPNALCMITLAQIGVQKHFKPPVKTNGDYQPGLPLGVVHNSCFSFEARQTPYGPAGINTNIAFASINFDIQKYLSQGDHVTDFFVETGSDSDVIIAAGGRMSPEWGATKHETIILCSGWQQGGAKGIRVRMNWVSDSPPKGTCIISLGQIEAAYFKPPVKTTM